MIIQWRHLRKMADSPLKILAAHRVCCDVDFECLISCRCVRSASERFLHFRLTVGLALRSSAVSAEVGATASSAPSPSAVKLSSMETSTNGRVSSWNLAFTALTPLSRSTKWNWFQPNRFWMALTIQTRPSQRTHSPTEIKVCDDEAILTKHSIWSFFSHFIVKKKKTIENTLTINFFFKFFHILCKTCKKITFPAIFDINFWGWGGVQQPEFPEGDFLSKEGDFCRSRELRQLQNTHHHAIIKGSNMIVCVLLVSNSLGCCLAAGRSLGLRPRDRPARRDNTLGSLTPTIHTQSCLIP